MKKKLKPLTERDLLVLEALASVNASHERSGARGGWAKPMDCGGTDASHHSATLKKLVRRGMVAIRDASEKRPGCSKWWRGACFYRINMKGKRLVKTRVMMRQAAKLIDAKRAALEKFRADLEKVFADYAREHGISIAEAKAILRLRYAREHQV